MSMLDPRVRGGVADYDATLAPSDLSADRHMRVGYVGYHDAHQPRNLDEPPPLPEPVAAAHDPIHDLAQHIGHHPAYHSTGEPAQDAAHQFQPEPAPEAVAAPPPPPKKRRRFGKVLLLLLLALVAWGAWAAGAFYDLTAGLRSADPFTLERRIDWASVREALREDVQAGAISPSIDRSVDALLSRTAVTNLLRTGKVDSDGWDTTRPTDPPSGRFDWKRIRYAFFTGSPFALRIDLKPDTGESGGPLVLLFRWSGDWRLTRVFLPSPTVETAAAAAPTAAAPAAVVTAPEPPPAADIVPPSGTQRAALFEEVPSNMQGRRYTGTVTWRTEQVPPVAGGLPGLAITASVDIPERPLKLTMAIRRNMDQSLPASHVVEFAFDVPANSTAGGVQDMVGVMMKPNEEAPGQNLVGSRVRIRDGLFLFGLSAVDVDLRHNTTLLRDRPWIGLPIRFSNGSRAVLVIEKGDSGDKTVTDAFAQWGTTPAISTNAQRR